MFRIRHENVPGYRQDRDVKYSVDGRYEEKIDQLTGRPDSTINLQKVITKKNNVPCIVIETSWKFSNSETNLRGKPWGIYPYILAMLPPLNSLLIVRHRRRKWMRRTVKLSTGRPKFCCPQPSRFFQAALDQARCTTSDWLGLEPVLQYPFDLFEERILFLNNVREYP